MPEGQPGRIRDTDQYVYINLYLSYIFYGSVNEVSCDSIVLEEKLYILLSKIKIVWYLMVVVEFMDSI